MEELDSQLFDKLQAEAVKKFYEVRVLCRVFGEEEESGRAGIIRLLALCRDLGISGPHSEEKKEQWGGGPGERLGGNINQCAMGVWLSGSALSAQQIGKHFNGFLSTAPPLLTSPAVSRAH